MQRSYRARWFGALSASGAIMTAVVLSGCAQPLPSEPVAPDAQPVSAVDCRTEGTWWWPDAPETPDPAVPTPGRVPAGFEPVAALRCMVDLSFAPVDGVTPEPPVRVQRFEGNLTPLLRALAQPDDPTPPDIVCTADMELVPPLWLESADGALIPVRYPRTACGKTKPEVREELERLDLVSTTDAPLLSG